MKKLLPVFILGVLLILGSLGKNSVPFLLAQLSLISVLFFWTLFTREAKSPPGFILYLIFLGIVVWKFISGSRDGGADYLYLFAGGGLLWFSAFNQKEKWGGYLEKLILVFGLVMAALYVLRLIFSPGLILPQSLFTFSSAFKNHNHIGDLWAIVLLVVARKLVAKGGLYYWLLAVLGLILMYVSFSRSAVVAFLAGAIYLFGNIDYLKRNKYIFASLFLGITAVFLLTSINKSIFFSRPYFTQAISGLSKYPSGVGMGNFKLVSSRFDVGTFSSIVHNLVLEVMVGLGWIGVVFVVWLGNVLWQGVVGAKNRIAYAVFLGLTVNFLFDSTYLIPSMVWLWFLSLGLSRGQHNLR